MNKGVYSHFLQMPPTRSRLSEHTRTPWPWSGPWSLISALPVGLVFDRVFHRPRTWLTRLRIDWWNYFRQVRPQRVDRPRRVLREDCRGSQRGGGAMGEDKAHHNGRHVNRFKIFIKSFDAIERLQVLLHLFASTFGMSPFKHLTFTGGCLASGYSYAQNLLSQMEPVNSLILCLNVTCANYSTKLSAATQRHLKRWWMSLTTWGHHGI